MEQEKKNNGFIRGLLCGVLLTLICLTVCLAWLRYQILRRYQEQTSSAQQTETGETETESALDLDTAEIAEKIEEIEGYINEEFLGSVDSGEVEQYIYAGLVAGLGDAYSGYYSAQDLERLNESTDGEYAGVGLLLEQDSKTGEISVTECYEDTPAMDAGIESGDVILSVNGEDASAMELTELVSKIRNSEDATISLTLQRGSEKLEVEVEMREVQITTVSAEMLEDQIGYLKITEFDTVTTDQFTEKLAELKNEGMEKLIVDVRDNPGGVLQVACDVLDEILPEGLLVSVVDKDGERSEYYSDEENSLDMPLAVLINENSASASEIFAGAVKDFNAGTLVGVNTYGKGVVQRVFTLSDGSGVKLTIAKYYTPDGTDIHEKGIAPDVEVEEDEETSGEDAQLQKAVELLEKAS